MRVHSSLVIASIIGLGAVPTDQRSIVPIDQRSTAAQKRGKFEYIGVNESGAEFGEKTFPGVKGKDVRNNRSPRLFDAAYNYTDTFV
jgi:hypothetical protein